MTPTEDRIAKLETRLFGLDGQSGLAGDVTEIKLKLREWDGAIKIVKYAGSILGLSGIVLILRALSAS